MKRMTWAALFGLLAACDTLPPADESYALGNGWLDSGRPEQAISAYDDAIEVAPRFAMAYNNRGLAKASIRDFRGAEADYDRCLQIIGASAEIYYNRGVARFQQGRKSEAIADFTEAVRLDPGYARGFAGRGLALASNGDLDAARLDLKRALDLSPTNWNERGRIEAELARITPLPVPK